MTTNDIDAIRREWLRQCGLCDAGLLTECTCPKGDVRSVVSALCDEVEQLRAELGQRKEGIDRLIAFRNAKVWESTELVQRVRAARALAEGADGDGDFGSVSASDLLAALGDPHPAESRPAFEAEATR